MHIDLCTKGFLILHNFLNFQLEESIEKAGLKLIVELWFAEDL